jgi:hypothetical protein
MMFEPREIVFTALNFFCIPLIYFCFTSKSQPCFKFCKWLFQKLDPRLVINSQKQKEKSIELNQNCTGFLFQTIIVLSLIYYVLWGEIIYSPTTRPFSLLLPCALVLSFNLVDLVIHVIPQKDTAFLLHHSIAISIAIISFSLPLDSALFVCVHKIALIEFSSAIINLISLCFQSFDKFIFNQIPRLNQALLAGYYVYMAQRFIWTLYGFYLISLFSWGWRWFEQLYLFFVLLLCFFNIMALITVRKWFHRKIA